MKKYKIKLQTGDYAEKRYVTIDDYKEIGRRFILDGCPINEFGKSNSNGFEGQEFFGWSQPYEGFYHASQVNGVFDGRKLTYDEIMELAQDEKRDEKWDGKGLPPVGTKCIALTDWCEEPWIARFHGKEVEIILHEQGRLGKIAVFRMTEQDGCYSYHALSAGDNDNFKQIKSDREKAIEKAAEHLPFVGINENSANEFLGKLYDAGLLKLPEEK